MRVEFSVASDFDSWISLAREVEYLFGPMADDTSFQGALKQAISGRVAFCIRSKEANPRHLMGGVVISKETNEIVWMAVSNSYRAKGNGKKLLSFAMEQLDIDKTAYVQTFNNTVPEGLPARKLYTKFGFNDHENGGLNPAGIPTVIMRRIRH